MHALLQGTTIGFCIAAPVGPIGLLCIRRSMTEGRVAGFVSGLGAAAADGMYGILAVSGLSAVTHLLLTHRNWIQTAGGIFLLYLGGSILLSKPPSRKDSTTAVRISLPAAFTSTFLLTLSNPATILSFIGIFAGLGLGTTSNGVHASSLLVAGVVLGSTAWWLLLSGIAGWMGRKATAPQLRGINFAAGAIVIALGVAQLVALAREA